jgi:hypothetical protein
MGRSRRHLANESITGQQKTGRRDYGEQEPSGPAAGAGILPAVLLSVAGVQIALNHAHCRQGAIVTLKGRSPGSIGRVYLSNQIAAFLDWQPPRVPFQIPVFAAP